MSSWTPHIYRQIGQQNCCDPELLQRLIDEGQRLNSLGSPVVFSLRHLATICNVPFGFLHQIVRRQRDPYRIFKLRKKAGGYRHITVPHPQLMVVQRWIHDYLLKSRVTSQISMAFKTGCSPLKNAEQHTGALWLVKIDLERFFESISERQVYRVFRSMGYRPLLAFEFTRLCTLKSDRGRHYRSKRWRSEKRWTIPQYNSRNVGHLPQGAPTSPILANLVCAQLDTILIETAKRRGLVVTRYADDIVFSGSSCNREDAEKIIREVDSHLRMFGFRRNATKTHIVSPGARKIVTGLLVDREKPALTRDFRDRLRCHLHYAGKFGIAEHCRKRGFKSLLGFKNHLRGLIVHASQIDSEFARECQERFDGLPWGLLANFK